MKNLTATICLMIAVLLGSAGMSWGANFQRDYDAAGKGLTAYSTGDYATALREFQPLAEQGNTAAQAMMGEIFDSGKGVKQDYVQAARWYRKAANQGHAKAQYNLGGMYDSGQGVSQDYKLAAHWFLKAAKKGVWQAYFNLGNMHYEGKGVSKNYQRSFQFFKLSAETGSVLAQYRFAYRYHKGQGIIQDNVYAHMWWNLASMSNNRDQILEYGEEIKGFPPSVIKQIQNKSLQNRNYVAKSMTPSQIETAQKLAQECVRKKYKGC
jgi:uncharacterized protein